MLSRLNYIESPAFGKPRGLSILFNQFDESATLCRYYEWSNRLCLPTEEIAVDLSEERIDFIQRNASRLCLPIVPEELMGLDGIRYKLELHAGMHQSTLEWWTEMPPSWQSLQHLCEYIKGLFPLLDSVK